MTNQFLSLHHFLPHSRANGPGLRAVLWVQGCSLGCPGCFNPETHAVTGGELVAVDELRRRMIALQDKVEGLTISGGEPLQQRPALLNLLQQVRQETSLSILLFTGFSWPEIQRMPQAEALLACLDVLLAGRYDASQRLAHHLLGSANKTIHFLTDRYTASDLQAVPPAEVVITPSGELLLTGIDPLTWS
jgi:anaerobic ribonucleoside-triphosphate reductase activating protein